MMMRRSSAVRMEPAALSPEEQRRLSTLVESGTPDH